METEKIILQLANQIETIKAHINRVKKPGYCIHELDVDLLRSKTLEFYSLVNELSDIVIPQKAQVVYVPKSERVKIQEELVESEKTEEKQVEKPKVSLNKDKKEENEVVPPKVIENNSKTIVESKPIIVETAPVIEDEIIDTVPQSEPVINNTKADVSDKRIVDNSVASKHTSTQTTYELFSENSTSSVIEKLITHEEVSIADKMQKTKILNIREAIGINDKFLFINSLFSGDLSRYNKILDEFNELTTKKGIDTYLREVKVQFRWNDETDAYIRFKEILDRKFA